MCLIVRAEDENLLAEHGAGVVRPDVAYPAGAVDADHGQEDVSPDRLPRVAEDDVQPFLARPGEQPLRDQEVIHVGFP